MTDKKVIIVTGASRGIGKAIASTLVADGFFVVGTGVTENSANSIKEDLGDKGDGLVLDVSNKESRTNFINTVLEKYIAVYGLINNGGITRDNLALRLKKEDWQAVIDTNLTGTFLLTQDLLKQFVKQRQGKIVNITSIIASMGNVGQTNYAAAKAGVISMTKSLARELGARGLNINCVSPGFIKTDMTDKLSDDVVSKMTAQIPLNKLGNVQDVANAVSFLVSDKSSYITGEVLHVNGGMLMSSF